VRVLRLVSGLKNDKVTANFMTDTLYYSDRPKEVEDVVCGTYGREQNALQCIGRETLRKRLFKRMDNIKVSRPDVG